MVRVTHVVFDLDGGGMESLVGALARRWAGTPVRMSIVSLSGRRGRVGEMVAPVVEQFHAVHPVRGVSMVLPLGTARTIRRTRPDIVNLHSGAWLKGAWAARIAGNAKVVYTEHGREHADPLAARLLDRAATGLTDMVVTVSDRLGEYMHRQLRVPRHRLCTIENGVDTDAFAPGAAPDSLRSSLGIPAGATVVGSVGRLETVKAFHRLIEAFDRMLARGPDRPAYLVIVGEGSERAALERQVAAAGLGDRVRLPGWVDQPAAWYRLFDVFALSSDSEGLSVSLLEAMASGCAPVVTDVGANAFVLGRDLQTQVVPPGDVEALAARLAATIAAGDRAAQLRREARLRVQQEFSLDRMAGRYEALYHRLLAGAPHAP